MITSFVAVIGSGTVTGPAAEALRAAGAIAVLTWVDLAECAAPDDVPTVVFDQLTGVHEPDGPGLDRAALSAVLTTLTSVDPPDGPDRTGPDVVVATTRPMVDTLKLVEDGMVTGTAARDGHRFVGAPIAARLRVLRELNRPGEPSPVALLAELARAGVTVLSA